MKVFTNPNIMNSSKLGLDFAAYSSVSNSWDVLNTPCYVNSYANPTNQNFQCQKYNDYVYSAQVDNTFTKTSNYGLYTLTCGQGKLVTCPSGDCSNSCRIWRGGFSSTSMATGSAGVFAIRNVTFPSSFHSPIEAGT